MNTRRGTRNLGRGLPRTTLVWVAVALVALVVIDVVLVALALGRTAPEQNGPAGPIPTFTSTPDTTAPPSPTGSAAPEASAEPASVADQGRRLLSALNGLEAWRASGGTCGGSEPVLEHTVDGGATWVPVGLGTDVGSLMAIRASSSGLAIMAGVGDDCATTVRTSSDGGATWVAGAAGAAGAGIDSDGVVLATETVDEPCSDPIEAFQGERTTVVICDGQMEWRTGTEPWVDVPLGGVRSIAVDGSSYTLASVGAARCAGVQIEAMSAIGVTSGTTTTIIGCAEVPDGVEAISIDRVDETVWLWAGDHVMVSADGGVTW